MFKALVIEKFTNSLNRFLVSHQDALSAIEQFSVQLVWGIFFVL